MSKRNSVPIRSDPRFAEEIRSMQIERMESGKDKPLKPVKTSRITLAMMRCPEWKAMKRKIIEADLP